MSSSGVGGRGAGGFKAGIGGRGDGSRVKDGGLSGDSGIGCGGMGAGERDSSDRFISVLEDLRTEDSLLGGGLGGLLSGVGSGVNTGEGDIGDDGDSSGMNWLYIESSRAPYMEP